MDYPEIGQAILDQMADESQSLRDRLYLVLTGALLKIGPPWPEDPEAYGLTDRLDQMLRALQEGLPPDPEGISGAQHMLDHMTDGQLSNLAEALTCLAEALIQPRSDLRRTPQGDTIQ